MDVEVLVSTMNKESLKDITKLVKEMNIHSDAIIVNQCNKDEIEEIKIENKTIRIANSNEVGLSKSRNKNLSLATKEIGIIADDDLVYVDNYKDIILNAYEKYPKADIICFWVSSRNIERSITKQTTKKINFISSMKISSCQITFKLESVKSKNIKFNEHFGAGSKEYLMGEENIFLFDCLRKKLKIMYVEQKIAEVKQEKSTWFKGFNEGYLISKGACFYRMSKCFSNILIYQFAIRKRKLFKENFSIITSIKIMEQGKKTYKEQIRKERND